MIHLKNLSVVFVRISYGAADSIQHFKNACRGEIFDFKKIAILKSLWNPSLSKINSYKYNYRGSRSWSRQLSFILPPPTNIYSKVVLIYTKWLFFSCTSGSHSPQWSHFMKKILLLSFTLVPQSLPLLKSTLVKLELSNWWCVGDCSWGSLFFKKSFIFWLRVHSLVIINESSLFNSTNKNINFPVT